MKVAMTGSSGLLGTALRQSLQADGHHVLRLVHGTASGPDQVAVAPRFPLDPRLFDDVDAVVNLAGAGVGDHRWTPRYQRVIQDSRVGTTKALVRALQSAAPRERTLVSASASGWYGADNGDTVLTEDLPAGSDFLATVSRDWEAATRPALSAGIRVVLLRTGLVLAPEGGALGPMLRLFGAGLGGRLGSGDQYWPTVTVEDHVRATRFLLSSDDAAGPYNVSGPEPATNREVTRALGHVLHRPTLLPVPAFALRAALGDFSSAVLGSARVVPRRLQEAGFSFRSATAESQVRAVLTR